MTKKAGCLTLLGIFLFIVVIAAIIALAPEEKGKKPSDKPKYTARQVYDFVLQYEIYGDGYTVGALTDVMCAVMKAQGDKVDVTDGKAWLVRGDVWRVSYVVVINDREFHTFEFEADMARKTVKPISKMARDIWGK